MVIIKRLPTMGGTQIKNKKGKERECNTFIQVSNKNVEPQAQTLEQYCSLLFFIIQYCVYSMRTISGV